MTTSFAELIYDPFHAVFYLVFVLTNSIFSKCSIEVSGSSVRDVARQLKSEQIIMKGHRASALAGLLNRHIPAAAMCGGAFAGLCGFHGGNWNGFRSFALCHHHSSFL